MHDGGVLQGLREDKEAVTILSRDGGRKLTFEIYLEGTPDLRKDVATAGGRAWRQVPVCVKTGDFRRLRCLGM